MKKNLSFELLKFFSIFFTTSLLTLGGGYAMVPIFQRRLSKYINEEEFLTILSVAQSVPGPIAINIAIMLGEHIFGFIGAVFAVLGVIIPPIGAIVLFGSIVNKYSNNILIKSFFKGVYGAIVGLIFGVLYSLAKRQQWTISKLIIIISAIVISLFLKNFIIIIFLALVWWCYNDKKHC
ncbi:MAG: chromate transporter [Thermosipho sp. (in: Bacteria)]|nr:chromate transporter [Thermosipho sp. (in: thermotogales)]